MGFLADDDDECLQRSDMMILSKPENISTIQRNSPSSLGCLDCLPPEILLLILEPLDFRSLYRVFHVSRFVARSSSNQFRSIGHW